MPRKLVIYPPVELERWRRIQASAEDAIVINATSPAMTLEEIRDAQGFFGKITPEFLQAAEQLEWVQSPTASLEHYLFPELIGHRCRVSNMRGLFSDVVADHVLGLMLCFTRNLHIYLRQQVERRWAPVGGESTRPGFAIGPGEASEIDRRHRRLADCTLGVIGVGAIGSEICRRATAFGMSIRGIDPIVCSLPGVVDEVWPVERQPELLASSDFVVIAAPHTPATAGAFGREQFEQMRPGAVLINIGRGAIVSLEALVAALESGRIAGAALDVYETEPLPPEHALWGLPNVILTPHVAAMSERVPERHLAVLLENVRRFARREEPLNLVDKRRWF